MATMNVHYSSKTDLWATPQEFFNILDAEFNFTLDPCSDGMNNKCERYFTAEDDGLAQSWAGETVFMNPPYGRAIGKWIEKAYTESVSQGALVVCLIPSRTDTRYWHDYCMKAHEIRFIKSRLYFGDGKGRAPFPSAVVIFNGTNDGMPKLAVMEAV